MNDWKFFLKTFGILMGITLVVGLIGNETLLLIFGFVVVGGVVLVSIFGGGGGGDNGGRDGSNQ